MLWSKANFRGGYDYMEAVYGHFLLRCLIVFCLIWLTAFVFKQLTKQPDAGAKAEH